MPSFTNNLFIKVILSSPFDDSYLTTTLSEIFARSLVQTKDLKRTTDFES